MTSARPLPLANELTDDYWQGAREQRLVLRRCMDCGYYMHPPRPTCGRCQSERVEAAGVSGRGSVYSFSVMHRPGNPGFEEQLPYAVVIVELVEQPGLITVGNLLDCPPAEIQIGMQVEVAFEAVTEAITLPQWRPMRSTEGGKQP